MNPSEVPAYVMNTLCRICAEKSSKLTPIFKNETLAMEICKCLCIQVKESDNLPLNVCELCYYKVHDSYAFYETAQKADEKLKKLWKILVKETMCCYSEMSRECNKEINLVDESQSAVKFQEEAEGELCQQIFVNVAEETVISPQEKSLSNEIVITNKPVNLDVIHNVDEKLTLISGEDYKSKQKEIQVVEFYVSEEKDKMFNFSKEENTKVFECHICSRQLPTIKSLNAHESTHSKEKTFLCDVCGKAFQHANNLRCHSRIHLKTRKKYICKICSKPFLTNFFLLEHMNSHSGETPYKCLVCKKEFREKVHLRQHKWTHSTEKFICPVCGSKFSRKGNMSEHMKKFHKNTSNKSLVRKNAESFKENTYHKCPSCSTTFPNQILLKNHLKVHAELKRFCCAICGKKFRHSGSLTYHRRTAHTGEKPFQCSYCDQKFSLRSVQIIHERKNHTFEQPYKCPSCFRLFTNSSSLRNHSFIHSKEKMFECEDCGKKFSRSSNLMVHKKLHTGDRKFTCDQCGKSYIQKHDMVKHMKVHDPKPFFCVYCGNSFSQKKHSSKHAMCQFDFLKKNNMDVFSAEKTLDSATDSLAKNCDEFFIEEEGQLILKSVDEFFRGKISKNPDFSENQLL